MADLERVFVTKHEYNEHQEKQLSLIEEGNRQVRQVQQVQQELQDGLNQLKDEVDARFNQVDARFNQVDARFNQVDARFNQIDARLNQIDAKFNQVDARFNQVDARLSQIDGRSFNQSRLLPWHNISPIGIYDPDTGFKLPDPFPKTVGQFWKLQFPPQQKTLIYLLRFYDVQNYSRWSQADDVLAGDHASNPDKEFERESSSESDLDESQDKLSLEEAVQKYPHLAIDELGSFIGLNLEPIRSFYTRAAEMQKIRPSATKRQLAVEAPTKEAAKHFKETEPRVLMQDLALRPPTEYPTSSPLETLGWDTHSVARRQQELIDRMYAARSTSETDVIPSDEPRDLGVRGA